MLGKKARIIDMKYDGKALLEMCDVFVGSGGTAMTAEAAFMGVPSDNIKRTTFSANLNIYDLK